MFLAGALLDYSTRFEFPSRLAVVTLASVIGFIVGTKLQPRFRVWTGRSFTVLVIMGWALSPRIEAPYLGETAVALGILIAASYMLGWEFVAPGATRA